ncbi:MAG: aminomethyl-transferring glycine dehydrogenase subunit GcvPA [Acidobacteria bacterium]|nr:aminomethyl-transferring glycine dehydrogenase subunit GcvPA [Acidobacteriota bacterium]
MRYLPKSDAERRAMLARIGAASTEDLFASIPGRFRLKRRLGVPGPLSEPEILDFFYARAAENAAGFLRFLGAGAYPHFRPVVIDALASRGEFFTAYTPYQPEISQGTLQAIFEFQTLVCQLTGQEVSNASLYDGSTALPEAVIMAVRITNRTRVLVARSVHPEYRQVLATYAAGQQLEVEELPYRPSGQVDTEALLHKLNDQTAAVAIQSPNFFGCLEDVAALAAQCERHGALLITVVNEPVSLGLVRPPTEAHIVALECQPLGVPVSYGGPYVGALATKERYVRSLPGRLAGQTTDADGQRGFVLTLATREQHIRREKATSNICTNQALCALMATIFMSVYGKQGMRAVAEQNLAKAHYAAMELGKIPGARLAFSAPFFNEFTLQLPGDVGPLVRKLSEEKILAGVELERFYPELKNALLVCVTETHARGDIDRLVAALRAACRQPSRVAARVS